MNLSFAKWALLGSGYEWKGVGDGGGGGAEGELRMVFFLLIGLSIIQKRYDDIMVPFHILPAIQQTVAFDIKCHVR